MSIPIHSAAEMPGETGVSQVSPDDSRERLLAACLSAVAPGAGQLLLGQRRKGLVLLFVFVLILCCFWPLRLPRFYAPITLVILVWLGLCFYAAGSALLGRSPFSGRASNWRLLAVTPLVYVSINLLFALLFLGSGFRLMHIMSSAMEPTIISGDRLVMDRRYYRHAPVERDDLVVMRRKDYITVKRVIAIGGDTIQAMDRQVFLNGRLLNEPFIQHFRPAGTDPDMDSFGPITVPEGKYFVMGDNRDVSLDSRSSEFGLLDKAAIVAKPLYVGWFASKTRRGKKLN